MARKHFHDRSEAGRRLAERLGDYAGRDDVTVLALPQEGVPVAFEVARALGVALDVFVVVPLHAPGDPDTQIGAIASGGARIVSPEAVDALALTPGDIAEVESAARRELARRELAYRGDRAPPELRARTALFVDDGLGTGLTMLTAIRAARQEAPARVVAAVPVAATDVAGALRVQADEAVCLHVPERMGNVGDWYDEFPPITDDEVRELLTRSRAAAAG